MYLEDNEGLSRLRKQFYFFENERKTFNRIKYTSSTTVILDATQHKQSLSPVLNSRDRGN